MEKYEPKIENNEPILNKYLYHDVSMNGNVIFECSAKDILEADALYEKHTGHKSEKQKNIYTTIEFTPNPKQA